MAFLSGNHLKENKYTPKEKSVFLEQVKLLQDHTFSALFINLLVMPIFLYLMWDQAISSVILIAWGLFLLFTMAIRGGLAIQCRRVGLTEGHAPFWAKMFLVGAFLTGFAWGAGGVLIEIMGKSRHIEFAIFILGGLALGAIGTTCAVHHVYKAFVFPAILPITVLYLTDGDPKHMMMGILMTLFLGMMMVVSYRYHSFLKESIGLRFENRQIIEELSKSHQSLQRSERWLNEITSQLAEGLFVLNADGIATFINPEAVRLLGWPKSELLGQDIHNLLHRDGNFHKIKESECRMRRALQEKKTFQVDDESFLHYNGEHFPISYIAAPMDSSSGDQSVVIAFQDISKRKQAEKELRNSEQRFQDIALSSADWIWEVDKDGVYTYASGKVAHILGYKPQELIGKTPFDFMSEEEVNKIKKTFQGLFERRVPISDLENWNLTKNGELICLQTSGVAVFDEKGDFTGYRGVDKDITRQKHLDMELTRMATLDPLTGLYNRREFERRMQEELLRSNRFTRLLSVLMLDIDHFKNVNDTYGHQTGDFVLKRLAGILTEQLRQTDTPARYGGEEFIILLPETGRDRAMLVAERIRRSIADSSIAAPSGEIISITLSIGAAVYPEHGDEEDSLISMADKALYRAKETGRNQVCIG